MCVHYLLNTEPMMYLDRIRVRVLMIIVIFHNTLLIKIYRNMLKYHDGQNQNIMLMIKICFMCVHYVLNTVSMIFLDRIRVDLAGLDDYFNVLYINFIL